MFRLLCLLIGYSFGCFQTAYIVSKIFYKIDIREHGSGNAGFTNTFRTLGAKAGVSVLIIDFIKAIIAFILCSIVFQGDSTFTIGFSILPGLYAGLGAILGHNYPFYLKFKGGKGVASSLGIIFCTNWVIGLILYGIGIVTLSATKYMSLASLIILGLFPVLLFLFGYGLEAIIIGAIYTVLTYYRHIENIQRLLKGTESKFSILEKIKKHSKGGI